MTDKYKCSPENICDNEGKMSWNLGNILHTDFYTEKIIPESSIIKIAIAAKVLNHSLAKPSTPFEITAAVRFSKNKLWVGKRNIEIGNNMTLFHEVNFFL